MSQRVAGERARWLAAVLMVTSIAAGSVIVRIWPGDQASPVLASRHIPLYQAPVAPHPARAIGSVPLAADDVRPAEAGRHLQDDVDNVPVDVAPATAAVGPADDLPEVAAEIAAASAALDVPVMESEAATLDDSVAVAALPAMETVESAPVVATASPSRGIAELPAVAVTRAVTIAGRGIMSGLKATTAILRAPF